VKPYCIVSPPLVLYQYLDLNQGVENLPFEQLIPQLSIEALIITILPCAARINVESLDPYSV
jgi:hypothetical protein